MTIPMPSTHFPPNLSASQPAGSWVSICNHRRRRIGPSLEEVRERHNGEKGIEHPD